MGWRAGSDSRAILGALLKCILIVTLIAGYPDIMKGGQSAFFELRNKFTNARDAKFFNCYTPPSKTSLSNGFLRTLHVSTW